MAKENTMSADLLSPGLTCCSGCAMELVFRHVLKALGDDIILVIPPGCAAVFCGYGNECGTRLPVFQGNLENSAAYAAGISRGLLRQGNDHTKVVAFAGDGATLDIGLQALSGMMERNDNVLYICYDNEAYMNTGIQGSSSTPMGAWSTTTPGGKPEAKKDLLRIAMAHGIPYCASASAAYLADLSKKVKKGREIKGSALIHVQCPCPTGWGYPTEKSVEVARAAVQSGAWILYEYQDGQVKNFFRLKNRIPVSAYTKLQKRFAGMDEATQEKLQSLVDREYAFMEQIST